MCTFYGFIIESDAEVLPCRPESDRKIEFIGDSVTSAFGNEGKATSSKSRFGIKGRMENVYNGYACILARMFDAEAHVLAWTGKGVHSNAGDWGPNLPMLWKNTIASREGEWDMESWKPDVVVVNLGANDLFPPASLETEIVSAYALFLAEVRQRMRPSWSAVCVYSVLARAHLCLCPLLCLVLPDRPHAHIFCVAYDESCMSAEDSETNRSLVALQLQEIVKVAMSRVGKHDSRMHYAYITVRAVCEDGFRWREQEV